MADFVLVKGLGAATLRPLAAAAGTSDRMLLYYFADKDELLGAVLQRIVDRMIVQLDAAVPPKPPRTVEVLLGEIWAALDAGNLQPVMNVWLELASGAARGLQPHRDIAGQLADHFVDWIATRLKPERRSQKSAVASMLFAAMEGSHILKSIGKQATADAAIRQLRQALSGDR